MVEKNELKEEKTCVEENSRAGILGHMKSIYDHSCQLLTTHIKKHHGIRHQKTTVTF